MNTAGFWALIDNTHKRSGNDCERQAGLLLVCVILLAACLLGAAYFNAALQAITPDELVGTWRASYAGRRNFDNGNRLLSNFQL